MVVQHGLKDWPILHFQQPSHWLKPSFGAMCPHKQITWATCWLKLLGIPEKATFQQQTLWGPILICFLGMFLQVRALKKKEPTHSVQKKRMVGGKSSTGQCLWLCHCLPGTYTPKKGGGQMVYSRGLGTFRQNMMGITHKKAIEALNSCIIFANQERNKGRGWDPLWRNPL